MRRAWAKRLVELGALAVLAAGCVGQEPVLPTAPECADPLVLCDGSCVDTSADALNCGACGMACDTAHGEACAGGSCALASAFACGSGTTSCGGLCVNTKTNAAHCGACTKACDVAGGEVCSNGSCALACAGGATQCDADCVNTDDDPEHCGDCATACSDGQVCSAGKCTLSCAGGTSLCGQSCVDFTSDPLHCGDCKTTCDVNGGETCANGKCTFSCTGGTTQCGDACVDTGIDPNHCGGCDVTCDANATCSGGECVCADGYTGDGTTCTDVDECAGDNDCSPSGECINTPGGYACACHDDQTGDGTSCTGLELVTVASTGSGSAGVPSALALSDDGRYVAFVTSGHDFGTAETSVAQAYERDMLTGDVVLASIDDEGEAANGEVDSAISLSGDGNFVAFAAKAPNLGTGVNTLSVDVRDIANDTTLGRSGSDSASAQPDSGQPALSDDGGTLVFHSLRVLTDTTPNGYGVYLSTGPSDPFVLVSVSNAGDVPVAPSPCTNEANADAVLPSVSGDGKRVAFVSAGTGLTAELDTNCNADVFLRDLGVKPPTTTLLSVNTDGSACTDTGRGTGSSEPAFSADGNFVAFSSSCMDLLATRKQLHFRDIFVRDLTKNTLEDVSVSTTGGEANGDSSVPQISADGRYVAFVSYASNLVSGDTNLVEDVFVHDRTTNKTTRVDLDADGKQIDDGASTFAFSSNGAVVAFIVYQSLLPADTTGNGQIYLRYLR
ncbi:MAG TPA: hypothetical protein VMI54_13635 [Polyangiaceae bacterium]|nr:hypothetical protein [Polyangiaceae bacterium]